MPSSTIPAHSTVDGGGRTDRLSTPELPSSWASSSKAARHTTPRGTGAASASGGKGGGYARVATKAMPAIVIIARARHKERFDAKCLVNSADLPRMGGIGDGADGGRGHAVPGPGRR